MSPYLTEVSRKFCEEEFILDSPALINVIKGLNYSGILTRGGGNIRLFTLDVIIRCRVMSAICLDTQLPVGIPLFPENTFPWKHTKEFLKMVSVKACTVAHFCVSRVQLPSASFKAFRANEGSMLGYRLIYLP